MHNSIYIPKPFLLFIALMFMGGQELKSADVAPKPAPFTAWQPAADFRLPEIVLQYDPATKTGANWTEVSHPLWGEVTPPIIFGRAANFVREGLKRMTGKDFPVVSKNDLSKGIVLTLLQNATPDIRNDPEVQQALQADPKNLYAAKEAFYIRSEKDRVLVVANTPDGLTDAVVELLGSVDYEILGMGPDWIYAPDYKTKPLVFALTREGRPSFYMRDLHAMGGQAFGAGTIISGLTDPADETVYDSEWRWWIGARIYGSSMPGFPGHALYAYQEEVVRRMKAAGLTEGFLSPKTVLGPDAQRPPASADNNGWLWINTDPAGQPAADKVYFSDGSNWAPQPLNYMAWNLDLSVPIVRDAIFEGMKKLAEASFASHPGDPVIFDMEAEDGAPGNAMLEQRMRHKNWYPEYLAKEGIAFGKPYKLNGYQGLDQPNETWDPSSASDNMFGTADYLLREFDKWIDSLPKDQQVTSTGQSKKSLIRCSFYSYNYHDVPPNFNPDTRVRIMVAGFAKHRGRGKWAKFLTNEEMGRAFKILLPNEPSGDYRYLSNPYYMDLGGAGLPAPWSAAPSILAEDYRRSYDAGFRAIYEEGSFNFGKFGLGYYLISQMLWNANLTPKELDAIRDRWFQRAFGSAWKEMKSYYDFMLPENYPVNAPHTWAKAIRLIDAAGKKIDGAKEPEAQRRIDDVKQYWYYHYLMDGGKYTVASPEMKEYFWKGQMSYMMSMEAVAQHDFKTDPARPQNEVNKAVGPQISAGPAHYTHAETEVWWAKVLDFWKVTPVIVFSETTLANGKPAKEVDLNDLVEVEEFKTTSSDVPFYYNSGYQPAPSFLMVALKKEDPIGFKLLWPFHPNDSWYDVKKLNYGVDIWNPAQKQWDTWVDKTMTDKPTLEATNAKGEKIQVVDVQLKAPRPGTYRFNIGFGGNAALLANEAYDPVKGVYAAPDGFTYGSNGTGLSQSPTYFYIPKGTKSLDLEVWDLDKGKTVHLYRNLPAKGLTSSRNVEINEIGTHTIALEPGEDGTVVMFGTNGFSFPYLYSIPTLWAKSPSALLVPRAIAEADGLTIVTKTPATATGVAPAKPFLSIAFNYTTTPSPDQPGFTPISGVIGSYSPLPKGIVGTDSKTYTVGLTSSAVGGILGHQGYDGMPVNKGDFTYASLYTNTAYSKGTSMVLSIAGVAPGATYTITLFSWYMPDPFNIYTTTFAAVAPSTGAGGTVSQIPGGGPPISNLQYSATFDVTSTTSELDISIAGSEAPAFFNGFTLAAREDKPILKETAK